MRFEIKAKPDGIKNIGQGKFFELFEKKIVKFLQVSQKIKIIRS
jgi:hypothetical protein